MRQKTNLETIKLILENYKQANGTAKYYGAVLFGFFASLVSVAEPFFFIKIIDTVETFYKTWVFNFSELFIYIAIWLWFIIFSLAVAFIYRYYFVDKWNLVYYTYLFKKYSSEILHIQYWDYLWKRSGELYSQFNKWVRDSFSFLFFLFLEVFRNLGIILVVIVLFFIHPMMTIMSVSMLPVLIFLGYFFNKKTAKLQKDINDFDDSNYGILADSLTNLSLVKNLLLEKTILKKMYSNIDMSLLKQYWVSKRWSISDVSTGFLVAFARTITVIYWVYLISIWDISLALLFLYFSFIGWIYFPLSFIFSRLRNIQEQLTSVWKFFSEMDKLSYEQDINNWKKITKIQGSILFDNVNFNYVADKNVLKNISMGIQPGQKIALVWNTGAGKSTIVNLLFRLWDISSWSIRLDGMNIQDISKSSLRNQIGLVAQDNSLFNMSIKENLKFANPKASKKDIEKALKRAQADFVFDLEKWINTVIWERWLKLSGWEKQRLSIARLFLKDPKILILDEATSALDNKTEKKIQKALDALMKWRTSIIIAHRLSTIQHADVIYMLENGKIIESWNYDELMDKKAKFYELANPDHLILN